MRAAVPLAGVTISPPGLPRTPGRGHSRRFVHTHVRRTEVWSQHGADGSRGADVPRSDDVRAGCASEPAGAGDARLHVRSRLEPARPQPSRSPVGDLGVCCRGRRTGSDDRAHLRRAEQRRHATPRDARVRAAVRGVLRLAEGELLRGSPPHTVGAHPPGARRTNTAMAAAGHGHARPERLRTSFARR